MYKPTGAMCNEYGLVTCLVGAKLKPIKFNDYKGLKKAAEGCIIT